MLIPAASGWAMCLVLGGLWLMLDVRARPGVPGPAALFGGMGAIAAGQFVFMTTVADRLFPNLHRARVIWLLETAVFLAAVGLGVASVILVFTGGAN